ncbi:hypothetical protein CIK05_04490 [Bdellovibrio sp. qaytius]|nr:hypothetical protein CIK05_04490 [Bdellovibrio sp. qaytius]
MKNCLKITSVLVTIATLSNVAFGYGISANGIFNHGYPIHESITRKAAIDSGYLSAQDTYQMDHLIEGVRFNDDPEAYLAKGNVIGFATNFIGNNNGKGNATEIFHFGDYQFMHAMAKGGTPAYKVKNYMMLYAYHCWMMATDNDSFAKFKITYDNVVRKIRNNAPNSEYSQAELIAKNAIQVLPREVLFYNTDNQNSFQNRALGSLIHMIQDSYAKGHVVRVGWEDGSNLGDIRYFQDYKQQDSSAHDAYDVPKGKLNENSLFEIPGSKIAYLRTKKILEMAAKRCPWSTQDLRLFSPCSESVFSFLNKSVFALDENTSINDRQTHSNKELIPAPKPPQEPFHPHGG